MLEKRNLITTTNKTLKVSMKMENQIFPKKKKKMVAFVYAGSDSTFTDSDTENEMIIK